MSWNKQTKLEVFMSSVYVFLPYPTRDHFIMLNPLGHKVQSAPKSRCLFSAVENLFCLPFEEIFFQLLHNCRINHLMYAGSGFKIPSAAVCFTFSSHFSLNSVGYGWSFQSCWRQKGSRVSISTPINLFTDKITNRGKHLMARKASLHKFLIDYYQRVPA